MHHCLTGLQASESEWVEASEEEEEEDEEDDDSEAGGESGSDETEDDDDDDDDEMEVHPCACFIFFLSFFCIGCDTNFWSLSFDCCFLIPRFSLFKFSLG